MANEVKLMSYLIAKKGYSKTQKVLGVQQINFDGNRYLLKTISLSNNTYKSFEKGEVSSIGLIWLYNLSDISDVYLSFDNGLNDSLLMKAGEYSILRLPENFNITTLKAKANQAEENGILEYLIIENSDVDEWSSSSSSSVDSSSSSSSENYSTSSSSSSSSENYSDGDESSSSSENYSESSESSSSYTVTYLMAHYLMNDNVSNTTVLDNSRNNLDGLSVRNTSVTNDASGKINSALSFDGTNDYIEIAENGFTNLGANPFSVFMWAKSIMTSTGGYLVSRGGDPGLFMYGYYADGAISFYDGVSWFTSTNPVPTNDGAWHHLGITRDGGQYNFYIDGVAIPFTGNSDLIYSGKIIIGASYYYDSKFIGSIDDVRFYNIALSQEQVDAIYNEGNGTESENLDEEYSSSSESGYPSLIITDTSIDYNGYYQVGTIFTTTDGITYYGTDGIGGPELIMDSNTAWTFLEPDYSQVWSWSGSGNPIPFTVSGEEPGASGTVTFNYVQ